MTSQEAGAIGSRGPSVCQIKYFRLGCKVMNIKKEDLKIFLGQDPSISKFVEVNVFVSVFVFVFVSIFVLFIVFPRLLDAHFNPDERGRFQASLSVSLSLSLCPYLYYSLSSLGCWVPILNPHHLQQRSYQGAAKENYRTMQLAKSLSSTFSWQNFA